MRGRQATAPGAARKHTVYPDEAIGGAFGAGGDANAGGRPRALDLRHVLRPVRRLDGPVLPPAGSEGHPGRSRIASTVARHGTAVGGDSGRRLPRPARRSDRARLGLRRGPDRPGSLCVCPPRVGHRRVARGWRPCAVVGEEPGTFHTAGNRGARGPPARHGRGGPVGPTSAPHPVPHDERARGGAAPQSLADRRLLRGVRNRSAPGGPRGGVAWLGEGLRRCVPQLHGANGSVSPATWSPPRRRGGEARRSTLAATGPRSTCCPPVVP